MWLEGQYCNRRRVRGMDRGVGVRQGPRNLGVFA